MGTKKDEDEERGNKGIKKSNGTQVKTRTAKNVLSPVDEESLGFPFHDNNETLYRVVSKHLVDKQEFSG